MACFPGLNLLLADAPKSFNGDSVMLINIACVDWRTAENKATTHPASVQPKNRFMRKTP